MDQSCWLHLPTQSHFGTLKGNKLNKHVSLYFLLYTKKNMTETQSVCYILTVKVTNLVFAWYLFWLDVHVSEAVPSCRSIHFLQNTCYNKQIVHTHQRWITSAISMMSGNVAPKQHWIRVRLTKSLCTSQIWQNWALKLSLTFGFVSIQMSPSIFHSPCQPAHVTLARFFRIQFLAFLTDHLLTTVYQPLTDHLPTTYPPLTHHLPTTYGPLTNLLPTTYRPLTDHLLTTYQPLTHHLPTTYQPLTHHLPTTYWPLKGTTY